jgi:hypothetical protein
MENISKDIGEEVIVRLRELIIHLENKRYPTKNEKKLLYPYQN